MTTTPHPLAPYPETADKSSPGSRGIAGTIVSIVLIAVAVLLVLTGCSVGGSAVEAGAAAIPEVASGEAPSANTQKLMKKAGCEAAHGYISLKPEQQKKMAATMRVVSEKLGSAGQYSDDLRALADAAYKLADANSQAQFAASKAVVDRVC